MKETEEVSVSAREDKEDEEEEDIRGECFLQQVSSRLVYVWGLF